ncbi:divisome protein SepX/GlpR, partial [Streptomyces venezuelae]|uniref:divisome protein SepX/GlpR n=1 Tax=Streptomyces venezuelae TaxID=54571 RepID=UPI003F6A4798
MSSSGLIYAVIVGAWAAYLVPMWLRRQDELNEARPTERFSTAIRLLSGRAGMERRYAKELKERDRTAEGPTPDVDPDAVTEHLSSVDVRAFSAPAARTEARLELPATAPEPEREPAPKPAQPRPSAGAAAERARRGKVLARRRRVTTLLFAAFTLGAVVAAVGGVPFLWAPAVPALLLSAYIVHLRVQERRRGAHGPVLTADERRVGRYPLVVAEHPDGRAVPVHRPGPVG